MDNRSAGFCADDYRAPAMEWMATQPMRLRCAGRSSEFDTAGVSIPRSEKPTYASSGAAIGGAAPMLGWTLSLTTAGRSFLSSCTS